MDLYNRRMRGYRPWSRRAAQLMRRPQWRPSFQRALYSIPRPFAGPRRPMRLGGRVNGGGKAELKFIVSGNDDETLTDGTAYIRCLNAVEQGAGPGNRIGQQNVMKFLEFKVFIRPAFPAPADDIPDQQAPQTVVNVWIVLDKQPNGAMATGTEIATVDQYPNPTSAGRFRILYRKEFTLGPGTLVISNDPTGSGNPYQAQAASLRNEIRLSRKINLKNMRTFFESTGDEVTDIRTNAILLYVHMRNQSGDTGNRIITWNCMYKFTDP